MPGIAIEGGKIRPPRRNVEWASGEWGREALGWRIIPLLFEAEHIVMGTTEDDYKTSFAMDAAQEKTKREKALEHALDIRKFEIGLYWQRAAYFWALIAAAFAGYFAILSAEHLCDKAFLAYVVGCIGLLFTWAWCLVNRGSKQWQENWENHVDMLEDEITGPLYKTVLSRPESEPTLIEAYITGPGNFSVSKINQWVSSFTLCIWVTLIVRSFPRITCATLGTYRGHLFVTALTVVFVFFTWYWGQTDLSSKRALTMKKRTTNIGENQ